MLQITTQPALNPNYVKYHGKIFGHPAKDDYPVVLRLEVSKLTYIPDTEYHILCTLHSYRNNDDLPQVADNEILPLSGHFIQKDAAAEQCVGCRPRNLFEQMTLQKSLDNKNVLFRYEMTNCHIVLVDWKDDGGGVGEMRKSLSERKTQINEMNLKFVDGNADDEDDGTVFCIGFTVFEKLPNNEKFTQITPTTYSQRISLNTGPHLQRIVPDYGGISGGQEVALFFDSFKQYDQVVVKMYTSELHFDRKIEIHSIEILPKTPQRRINIIWSKNTILYQIPPLPKDLHNFKGAAIVCVEVYIPSTGETSNSLTFTYKKSIENSAADIPTNILTKVKNKTGDSIMIWDPSNPMKELIIRSVNLKWIVIHATIFPEFHQHFGDTFADYLHVVLQFPECSPGFRVSVDNGYNMVVPINVVLVSEAIEESYNEINRSRGKPFTTLTARKRNSSKFSFLDALENAMDFFHAYRELMIAEENTKQLYPRPAGKIDYVQFYIMFKCKKFRPMVTAKCSIVEQDLHQNTPLHTAILLKHRKSLDQFIEIFEQYDNYSHDFQEDLKSIFKVYNKEGHNVMHAAIMNNMEDLVKSMLVYCSKNTINVLEDFDVADGTNKVSIVQFAVDIAVPNIASLLLNYIPGTNPDVVEGKNMCHLL